MLTTAPRVLQRLATLLLKRAGLKTDADRFHRLKAALDVRMTVLKLIDPEEYLRRLEGGRAADLELRLLLPLVTVGKTEFFRGRGQFGALERRILPELLAQARKEQRRLLIWSAGCATGEEAYSLAMVLAEAGVQPAEAEIWATDVNSAAIEKAKLGRFSARQMSLLSPDRLRRFFGRTEGIFEVRASLSAFVRFDCHNLASTEFAPLRPGSVDLILCRNVIIYFDLATIRSLMDTFLVAMRSGAYLLLGYAESLFRVYEKFQMVAVESSFVYQKARAGEPVSLAALERGESNVNGPCRGPHQGPSAIESGARRPPSPHERLDEAARLMVQGQFEGALTALQALGQEDPEDLAALLMLGNLYLLYGRANESREAFDRVISRQPLCVEARIFRGVAALQAGLLEEARSELKKALFLEPTLALGHYLLAHLQERMGALDAAKRSYRNAIKQLRFPQRELAGHYPDLPKTSESIARVVQYRLAALEDQS